MKFSIKKNDKAFLKALSLYSVFQKERFKAQVLEHLMLSQGDSGQLEIYFTNIVHYVTVSFDEISVIDYEKAFLLTKKEVKLIHALLKQGDVSIEVNDYLFIESKGFKYRFSLSNREDSGNMPTTEYNGDYVTVKDFDLSTIKPLKKFLSNDWMRPAMCGVYFGILGYDLEFCGTDAQRAIWLKSKCKSDTQTKFSGIFEPSVYQIEPFVSKNATVLFYKDTAVFIDDNITISTRLMDNKYPNFKAIYFETLSSVMLDKKEVISILTLLKSICHDYMADVKMYIGKNVEISHEGDSLNLTPSSLFTLNSNVQESFHIHFRINLFLEVLSIIKTEKFEIRFKKNDNLSPCEIREIKDSVSIEDKRILIMPLDKKSHYNY